MLPNFALPAPSPPLSPPPVAPHRIASLEKTGMPLWHTKPQQEMLFGNAGDSFARQHHRADGHRNGQYASGGGRENVTLVNLLLRYRAFGGTRFQRVGGDIERRARLDRKSTRNRASGKQLFVAREIGLRLGELSL